MVITTIKSMGSASIDFIDRTVVIKHLQNIYSEGKLDKSSPSAKIARVQSEGNRTCLGRRQILKINDGF